VQPTLPLRAAVVGSGAISAEHLGFLTGRLGGRRTPDGSTAGRIRLVGICDLSTIAAEHGAATYGADAAYTDLSTMLADAQPDVVHVLTPPQTHVDLVSQALAAGAHVICEKPITPTSGELAALLEQAAAAGRHLVESHNYRFNQAIIDIAEAISAGRLGTVREVEIRVALPVTDPNGRFGDPNLANPIHSLPAGVIHDFTTHFSYLLLHLAGPVHFDRIAAAWSNHGGNPNFTFDDLDATLIGQGVDGPVHGRLRFDAGAGPDTFSVTVRGSAGWVETDLFQPHQRWVVPRAGGGQLSPIANHVANGASMLNDGIRNVGRKIMQHTPYEGLHRMLDLTYTALAGGHQPPVTPDDMMAASTLVDRLLEAEVRL
jgi:predicted dehydrogenase